MEKHSEGRVIGYRQGAPIYEWITYKRGDGLVRMTFVRLAMEDQYRGFPLSQCAEDEFMIAPGAIYK